MFPYAGAVPTGGNTHVLVQPGWTSWIKARPIGSLKWVSPPVWATSLPWETKVHHNKVAVDSVSVCQSPILYFIKLAPCTLFEANSFIFWIQIWTCRSFDFTIVSWLHQSGNSVTQSVHKLASQWNLQFVSQQARISICQSLITNSDAL